MPGMTSHDLHPFYGRVLLRFVTNLSRIGPGVITMMTARKWHLSRKAGSKPRNCDLESLRNFASLRGGRRLDRLIQHGTSIRKKR